MAQLSEGNGGFTTSVEDNIEAAFEFAKQVMANPDAFPERMIVLPFDPELLASIFTQERLRLWRLVHRSKHVSITQLATKLDRDVSRVRHDLLILKRSHLVRMERRGNTIQVSPTGVHIMVASP